MSPNPTELETRLVSTLRTKSAQVPEPTFELDPDVVPLVLDVPRHPPRSRVIVIAAIAALVVAVAVGLAVTFGGGDDAQPAGRPAVPVAHVSIVALPELKFQAPEYTTVAGPNEIDFTSLGGTHSLVFADPELADIRLNAVDDGAGGHTTTSTTVDLVAGRDYTIYCAIPGHRQAGMEAVIHVIGPSATSTTIPPTTTLP